MKFLVCCNHGNVRSVALAENLKNLGHEAIAIGIAPSTYKRKRYALQLKKDPWQGMSEDTIFILEMWADKVIDMSDGFSYRLQDRDKYLRRYVGIDIYFDSHNKTLKALTTKIAKELVEDQQ